MKILTSTGHISRNEYTGQTTIADRGYYVDACEGVEFPECQNEATFTVSATFAGQKVPSSDILSCAEHLEAAKALGLEVASKTYISQMDTVVEALAQPHNETWMNIRTESYR